MHLNLSLWTELSCGAVGYAVQGGAKFGVCQWTTSKCVIVLVKATLNHAFLERCLSCCT